MKKTILINFTFLMAVLVMYQNCGDFEASNSSFSQSLSNGETFVEGDPELFNQFQKIMHNHCVQCHGASDSQFGSITDFAKLTNQSDWIESPAQLLVPGKALESKIYYRLTFAQGQVASQNTNMPLPFRGQEPTMSKEDAEIIAAYINSIQERTSVLASCEPDYGSGDIDLRRLTALEIKNSANDILGIENAFPVLPELSAGRFSNIAKFQSIDESFYNYFEEGASQVANQFAESQINTFKNCNRNSSCYEKILTPIAELLYRKTIDTEDKETYMRAVNNLVDHKDIAFTPLEIFEGGIYSMLLNPRFLYLIRKGNGSGEKPYTNMELVTRVSLALFASIPNRALWTKAKNGLSSTQYEDMITELVNSDEFTLRFVPRFAEGWLGLSKIDSFTPQSSSYGMNSNEFRPIGNLMKTSVQRQLAYTIEEEISVESLVTGNTRFLNDRLAEHLGVPGNYSSAFKLVNLPLSSPYANTGLLTSTPLVSTSLSDRESIVFRGVEVMSAFTCQTAPPPPPDVDTEIEFKDFEAGTSQRIILEDHSSNQSCAACHQNFDPYGFALDGFDGLGRFRTKDQFGNNIDSSGQIGGVRFENQKDMARILSSNNTFKNCMSQMFLAYSVGKNIDVKNDKADLCTTSRISTSLNGSDNNLKFLMQQVLTNRYFTHWLDK